MTPEKVTPKFKAGDVVQQDDRLDHTILYVGVDQYFTEIVCTKGERMNDTIDFYKECYWSLKPKEVTITREKFAEAWDTAVFSSSHETSNVSSVFTDLCKELGL